jgi:DNA-binding CsgD family transcriptional regulator
MSMEEVEQAGRWLSAIAVRPRGSRRGNEQDDARAPLQSAASIRAVPFIGFETEEEAKLAEQAFLSLSAREATVLAYLAYGLSAKEVAHNLSLSCRTVDTFRTRALLKLRARNTADAVRMLASLSAIAGPPVEEPAVETAA